MYTRVYICIYTRIYIYIYIYTDIFTRMYTLNINMYVYTSNMSDWVKLKDGDWGINEFELEYLVI
jgi:hypothetical protein